MNTCYRLPCNASRFVCIISFTLIALLYSFTAIATPKIEWTPSEITGTLAQGEARTISASFIVNKPIDSKVRFRIVPSLRDYVQVSPTSFNSLIAGETKTVNITFSADSDAIAMMREGVIQLRSRGTVAKPLPVTLVIEEGPAVSALTVIGRVIFDNGTPVTGAEVTAEVAGNNSVASMQRVLQTPDPTTDYQNEDFKSDPQIVDDKPLMFLQAGPMGSAMTDADGLFSIEVEAASLPARVRTKLAYMQEGLPTVDQTAWATAEMLGTLDMGTIVIPSAADAEMIITDGSAQTADGDVTVDNLPPEIARIFAKSFDPDAEPDAFPGDFAEMGSIPLNSAMFLWMEALDAGGNPVSDLSSAVTIRSRIPHTQWSDLEDIDSGTDRIEVPIYIFNEATGLWEQTGIGWLEDSLGTVLPEDAQPTILDGSFPRDIFAAFVIDHFSWMNVDYPFIGPWTLSRLDVDKRNNDCLFEAAKLAETIFRSEWSNQAYQCVNKPGVDLETEVPDAGASELKSAVALEDDVHGWVSPSDFKEHLYMSESLWDKCDQNKKETVMLMATVILHETAHWKYDVKKNDGEWTDESDDASVRGEAGRVIEAKLFGRILSVALANQNVSQEQLDKLTDPQWWLENESNFNRGFWDDFWDISVSDRIDKIQCGETSVQTQAVEQVSPLKVTLSFDNEIFELGDPIPATITYENLAPDPIAILDLNVLPAHPIYFDITGPGGDQVPFIGPKITFTESPSDYVELQPGAMMTRTIDLTRDTVRDIPHYNFKSGGEYKVQAKYAPFYGLPITESAVVTININPGGSLSGIVSNAMTGTPLAEATVEALRDGIIIASAETDTSGNYMIPELPPGAYALTARAPGFLRSTVDNIVVVAGENTRSDFSLSPLLTAGELRFVLTWSELPTDLDSHLWLPAEQPYHVAFFRTGSLLECPYATLDVDDTDSFGPETITISQRINEGAYTYSVFNFSETPSLTESQARLQVLDSSGLIATFNVPTTGKGSWWNVLSIDGLTGQITEINELSSTADPYPDTDSGCAIQ